MSSISSGNNPISNLPPSRIGHPGGVIEQDKTEEAAKGAATHAARPTPVAQDNFVRNGADVPTLGTTGTAIPPPGLPPVNPTADEAQGANVLADNVADAFAPVLDGNAQANGFDQLAVDELMKMFLMLNILDPNNSVETQNNLSEVQSNSRQQAIDAAQKNIENLKEQLAEAQKQAAMWGMISNLLLIINPMGLIFKMFGDSQAGGIIGGILAPEQMLVGFFGVGEAKAKVEDLEKDLAQAQRGIEIMEHLFAQYPPEKRAKAERQMNEAIETMKAETASAGEDGVPLKGLAQKLKAKLGDALNALQGIMAEQGPAAMMKAAPEVFEAALVDVFRENNLPNPEQAAELMGKILTIKLAMGILGNAQAENAVGPMTTQLAETIDPDSPVDVHTPPNEAFIAGQRDAIVQLRSWAEKFQAGSGSQNRNIQG